MRTNCGPFQQFGPHADQIRNCGPFWSHCKWSRRQKKTVKLPDFGAGVIQAMPEFKCFFSAEVFPDTDKVDMDKVDMDKVDMGKVDEDKHKVDKHKVDKHKVDKHKVDKQAQGGQGQGSVRVNVLELTQILEGTSPGT